MLLAILAALAMQSAPVAQDKIHLDPARKPSPRGRPQSWITDDDYPRTAFREQRSGPVGFRLDVDETGRVTGCHVTKSSGYAALDDTACLFLTKRAEFTPAQDAAGKDIPSVYNGTFTWVLPGGPRGPNPVSTLASTPVDVVVGLGALPKSYANPALLRIVFAGAQPKACIVETSSGSAKLDAVACDQARAQVQPIKMSGASPDSRMVTVTFEVAK